jgi:thiosulfate reductase cytochrome b subunit
LLFVYGFLFGFFLGWIPALILALLVAVATIFLWPLAAVPLLYLIYKVFGTHPHFSDLHRRPNCYLRNRNRLVVAHGPE